MGQLSYRTGAGQGWGPAPLRPLGRGVELGDFPPRQ
jgi:hypothetical protein